MEYYQELTLITKNQEQELKLIAKKEIRMILQYGLKHQKTI